MTSTQLRTAFAAVLVFGGLDACARPAGQPRVVGPVIGESTARGPADPSAPPPDAGGVTEVSARLHGTPSPVANPAPTGDTVPSTTGPAPPPANPAVVWAPGVVPAPAPAPPNPTNGAGTGARPAPGTPPSPGTPPPPGPVPVAPPAPTPPPPAPPPPLPGTPPLAPPNGPGSAASPAVPRAVGLAVEPGSRGASGTPASTPGGRQR